MKFNTKYIKKRIVLGFMVGLLSLTLTGCGGDLMGFATGELTNMLDNRFSKNVEIVDNLYEVELITETEWKEWKQYIEEQRSKTLKERKVTIPDEEGNLVEQLVRCSDISYDSSSKKVKGTTYRSFSHIKTYSDDNILAGRSTTVLTGGGKSEYDRIKELIDKNNGVNYLMLGNFLNTDHALDVGVGVPGSGDTPNSTIFPLHIIEEGTEFSDGIDFEIRVLKPNLSSADLDKIISITKSEDAIDYGELDRYFENAKDSSGDKVMFSDLIDLNNGDIIKESTFVSESYDENEPGKDLSVKQPVGGKDYYVGSLRFYEFNYEEIKKVLNFMGIDPVNNVNTEKWLIRKKRSTGNNVLYLMEYPVYYVTGFQDLTNSDNSIDKSKVEANINESNLAINLKTKELIYKYNGSSSIITSNGAAYYTLGDSLGLTSEDGLSSFMLNGYTQVNITDGLDVDKDIKVTTGRIILRDYLEATYAPGFATSDTSDLVVLGRKLRLINTMSYEAGTFNKGDNVDARFERETLDDALALLDKIKESEESEDDITTSSSGSGTTPETLEWYKYDRLTLNTPLAGEIQTKLVWDKDMPIAKFVNASGEILQDSPELMITDFASVNQLVTDKILLKLSEKNESITAQNPENRLETSTTDSLPISLTQNYVDTTTSFPGNYIGKDDFNADKQKMQQNASAEDSQIHQQFYAMFVATDFFEKGLFTSWLNSPDEEACLGWWVAYLNANGYLYDLSQGAVEDYLYKNYAYELSQDGGKVILDLKVVEFIQDQMDEQQDEERATWLRTLFRILGVLLIIYSSILMIAWLVDTNADFGFQIVTVMTLGHWIPIKDPDDCPYIDQEKRKYVDFTNVCISSSIMILVGVLLLLVDVFDIVLFLIKLLGGLAQEINKMLTGVI